jgi:hypothetical protein
VLSSSRVTMTLLLFRARASKSPSTEALTCPSKHE